DEFHAYYRRLTPIGYANALRALLAMDHITDRLAGIRVPVLLIGGDRDPPLATGRALTGQPLRQSRPARGVEPRGAGVPGTLRRRRARTTPRAPALRSGEAEQDVTRRRRWSCRSSRYRTSWWSRGPRDGLA